MQPDADVRLAPLGVIYMLYEAGVEDKVELS